MPTYDCGDPECDECQRAFGPDRTKAVENYRRRELYYGRLEGVYQAAGGGWREAEKVRELAAQIAEAQADQSSKAAYEHDGGAGSLGYEMACRDIAEAIRKA